MLSNPAGAQNFPCLGLFGRNIWRPSSLSKLIPIISNIELTHLGLEASILIQNLLSVFLYSEDDITAMHHTTDA